MFGLRARRGAGAPPDQLLLIRDNQAQLLPVDEASGEVVRAGGVVSFPRAELREVVRREGGRLFIALADLPALIEAERVRGLEESAVLRAVLGDEPPAAPPAVNMWTIATVAISVITLLKVMGIHHG